MSYDDWSHYFNASTNHGINTTTQMEGNGSLDVEDATQTDSAEVIAETDAPPSGRVTWYSNGNIPIGAIYLRFQDTNNYYQFGFAQWDYYDECQIFLNRNEGGNETEVFFESSFTSSGVSWENYTLSNGTKVANQTWVKWRFTYWTDTGEDLRFRIEEDSEEDGTWSQVGSDKTDIADALSGGGGIGVGGAKNPYDETPIQNVLIDVTEVFY